MYDPFLTERLIDLWLGEDIGAVDVTAQSMIEADWQGVFRMRARQQLIVSGIDVARLLFLRYDRSLLAKAHVKDGDRVESGDVMLTVSGNARSILTTERTALNIVQHLSGIATLSRRYVDAIAHTKARLIDTRKTTPGLRMLEKHAVSCGGGLNHRLSLDSGVMIKDNHIAVAGNISAAVRRARANLPVLTKLEVECDRLQQVLEAVEARADVILLDNMSVADIQEAVALVAGRAELEASGGIQLDTIAAVAQTGVDFISTSKITQSAPAVDIGLDAG